MTSSPNLALVEQVVITILARQAQCAPESLKPSDRLADLGVDSLRMAEAIFEIEEQLGLIVPLEVERNPAIDLSTVGGVLAAVRALLQEQTHWA